MREDGGQRWRRWVAGGSSRRVLLRMPATGVGRAYAFAVSDGASWAVQCDMYRAPDGNVVLRPLWKTRCCLDEAAKRLTTTACGSVLQRAVEDAGWRFEEDSES